MCVSVYARTFVYVRFSVWHEYKVVCLNRLSVLYTVIVQEQPIKDIHKYVFSKIIDTFICSEVFESNTSAHTHTYK